MRILQLVQQPQRRGAEVFAHQLSAELRRRDHRVSIVYLYGGEEESELPLHDDDVLLGGEARHPLERLAGHRPALATRLAEAIGRFAPDVVQLNGGRAVKYGALVALRRRRRPWALVYRNIGNPADWLRGTARKLLYRGLLMRQLDGVVGVSQTTLDAVGDTYRLRVPTAAIPRAVDPAALAPRSSLPEVRAAADTPADAQVVIYVGSLSPEKRPDRLLRVCDRAAAEVPGLHLWIVGDGPLRGECEARATESRLSGQGAAVRLIGRRADVGDWIAAADLLLLTSDTEGLPGVVLEAGCLGVPAVSTRVGGVSEAILDGESGLLADPDDEAGLTAAVVRLLRDPAERGRFGERARRLVRERFDLGDVAGRYLDFYRRVRAVRAGESPDERPEEALR